MALYLLSETMRRVKRAAKFLLQGERASEFFELVPEVLAARTDPDGSFNRLNIVTPTLSSRKAFGGVMTLIDLPLQAFGAGLAPEGWRARILCFGPKPDDAENIVLRILKRLQIDPGLVDIEYGCSKARPLPVSGRDVFLGSMWYHFPRILPLLEFQRDLNGGAAIPYVGMFQDYEASFYNWSSGTLLARAMYDADWPIAHIFNSTELADFYRLQGHRVDRQFVFQPVMNASLRQTLIETPPAAKDRQILFYGRPQTPRNCFYLARAALDEWSVTFPGARDWKVISVGESFPDFTLRNGARVEVKGKLALEDYSDQLRRSAVGLSLMASPHPSYPPLEMAHFGALTITNSFTCKNLSGWHQNIRSLDRATPQEIAAALARACQAFEDDPGAGLRGKSLKPAYLEDYSPQSILDCADLIRRCL